MLASQIFILAFSQAFAAADNQKPAYAKIEQEFKSLTQGLKGQVSFSLRDFHQNEVISVSSQKGLAPASVAKLVSTACSLVELGPQFQFETLYGFTGKVEKDTLKGNLLVRGSGDPSLVVEDLHESIEKIRFLHGIRRIEGKIIFDASYFGVQALEISNEGFEGDAGRSFTAPLTPTPINQNSFSAWLVSDVRGARLPNRSALLPFRTSDLKLNVGASKAGPSISYDPSRKVVSLSGSLPPGSDAKGFYRSVPDSYENHFRVFEKLWKESGGEWTKPSFQVETKTPSGVVSLWKHTSRPLSKILMDINKSSLNFGAEMVFLAAGVQKKGAPASFEKSKSMLSDCLKSFGVSEGSIVMNNASGLSREASIQTSALTHFLVSFAKHPFAPEYLSSLSLLGLDGTTKKRLQDNDGAGRARLKTGTLKDVHSIAGYVSTRNGTPLTMALFFNGIVPSDPRIKKIEDHVLESLTALTLTEVGDDDESAPLTFGSF